MIYVTGDTHADLERLKSKGAKVLKKGDILLVCGDFGFVWDGSKQEQKVLKWLGKRPYQILFLEGTHDNLDLLAQYPQETLYEGQARRVSGNCFHLLRGEVYTIEGRRFFTFGGGESDDMDTRTEGVTWWRGELPSQEEMERARENLAAYGNQVDVILTHTPSERIQNFLNMGRTYVNPLGAFLNEVSETVQYGQWFFGSCHLDKLVPPRHRAIYQEIIPISFG